MKKLLFLLTVLFLSSCNSGMFSQNYVNKDQKKRVKTALKQSYPDKKTRPHAWVFAPMK